MGEQFGWEAGDGRQCIPARTDQGKRKSGGICMGVELFLGKGYGGKVAEG